MASAAEPASCKRVRFSGVAWTDIAATTALATRLLKGLGDAPKMQELSVPVTDTAMKSKRFGGRRTASLIDPDGRARVRVNFSDRPGVEVDGRAGRLSMADGEAAQIRPT